MQNPRLVKLASEKGERKTEKKEKGKISGQNSGIWETPKTPESPKNKVARKASQKFSKIINII